MPRRKTEFAKGHFYHVFNRGVSAGSIFRTPENYLLLLNHLRTSSREYGISVISYCLMPNHYHFLLRQDSDYSISVCLQEIFNRYVKYFNGMFHRNGILFGGRFKSVSVDSSEALIHLCRYIHRNPIDTMPPLVRRIEDWPYSNYPDWMGLRNGALTDKSFLKEYFVSRGEYRKFVLDKCPLKVMQRMEKFMFD